ncbi:hypothetical protein ACX1NX_09875 [Acinetobacter sp. ANC 5383]
MSDHDTKNIEKYIDNLDLFGLTIVWFMIPNYKNYQPNNMEHFRNIIKAYIIPSNTPLNYLKSTVETNIIENHHINFLDKNNKRQITYFDRWIRNKIPGLVNTDLPDIFKSDLYIQSIMSFNSLFIEQNSNRINAKIQFLNSFKYDWDQLLLNKKDISWLDQNNEIQIEWAYEYIRKIKSANFIDPIVFNITNNSVDPTDLYTHVIIEIDALSLNNNPEKKQLLLDKMRRSWSQKKFRDEGKTKKPYHLPLTKEAHKQLEFLSQILNKPISQVLESMIRDKYQEYSDQKTGKNLY